MKQLGEFVAGIVLLLIGIVIFLQNTVVNSFSLMYHCGRFNAGGTLLILMVLALIWVLVKPNSKSFICLGVLAVIFVVGLVLNLDIRLARMSGLQIILILGMIAVGIALVIKSLIRK